MLRAALALSLALALPASAQITGARYADPTDRYGHGALGDEGEWGTLVLELKGGAELRFVLPAELVFEDPAPRLADVDNDTNFEVVVVESLADQGARIVIYDETGRIATSPAIGTRFRWLAIAGIADFDEDGAVEIAAVDRPHLARVLRYWSIDGERLVEEASLPGVTNHRYGVAFIEGGLRQCGAIPELILADMRWRRILAVWREGSDVFEQDRGAYTGPESLEAARTC